MSNNFYFVFFSGVKPDFNSKSLVLLLSWLGGKRKDLEKFCELYADLGFDVLIARIHPMQVFRPVKCAKPIANDIVNFLVDSENYERVVIHGFSAGGYLWGECLVNMQENSDKRRIIDEKVKAQVWDSIAGIQEVRIGVSKVLFPSNLFMQRASMNLIQQYLNTFNNFCTRHYKKSDDTFHNDPLRAPTLIFFSNTDLIGTKEMHFRIRNNFMANGIEVTSKCFNDSPHIQHFIRHKVEYTKYVLNLLESSKLIDAQHA